MEISKFISRSIHQVVKGLLDAQACPEFEEGK